VRSVSTFANIADHHSVVFRDPHAYSAHPHLAVTGNGDWLLLFTQAPRRQGVLHPPQDPLYRNLLVRSCDEGRSWTAPSPVPGFGWHGMECAGLTPLRSGGVLVNQWKFHWYTRAHAQAYLPPGSYLLAEDLMDTAAMGAELSDWQPNPTTLSQYQWARGDGETWVHLTMDGGATFTRSTRVNTSPFSGGYGMRGGFEIDGEVVLPLCDVPNWRQIFVIRSRDGGETWSPPSLVATGEQHAFEEPCPLVLGSGRVLMMLRDNSTRVLHMVSSLDGGMTWSAPAPTSITDYPADLLELEDGVIVCVAGRRRPPYGIFLYISEDEGRHWYPEHGVAVRADLPNRDLGYPSLARRADGSLFVLYYAQDAEGVTGIHATVLRLAKEGTAYGGG
jgi:BNR/Asp-box repeat.